MRCLARLLCLCLLWAAQLAWAADAKTPDPAALEVVNAMLGELREAIDANRETDPAFAQQLEQLHDQVLADPRIQEVQRQFELGELLEEEAREQLFVILKDHGIEAELNPDRAGAEPPVEPPKDTKKKPRR